MTANELNAESARALAADTRQDLEETIDAVLSIRPISSIGYLLSAFCMIRNQQQIIEYLLERDAAREPDHK